MPDATLAAIDARLAALALERARLDYVDSFTVWGAETRRIDIEVAQLHGQRRVIAAQALVAAEPSMRRSPCAEGPTGTGFDGPSADLAPC